MREFARFGRLPLDAKQGRLYFLKFYPVVLLFIFLHLNGLLHCFGRKHMNRSQHCSLSSVPASIKRLFAAKANFGKVMADCKNEMERAVRVMPKERFREVSDTLHVSLHGNSEQVEEGQPMSAVAKGDNLSGMTCQYAMKRFTSKALLRGIARGGVQVSEQPPKLCIYSPPPRSRTYACLMLAIFLVNVSSSVSVRSSLRRKAASRKNHEEKEELQKIQVSRQRQNRVFVFFVTSNLNVFVQKNT